MLCFSDKGAGDHGGDGQDHAGDVQPVGKVLYIAVDENQNSVKKKPENGQRMHTITSEFDVKIEFAEQADKGMDGHAGDDGNANGHAEIGGNDASHQTA